MLILQKQTSEQWVGGGRCGTAIADYATMQRTLGEPSYRHGGYRNYTMRGDKVTISWIYHTPRGYAEVRDYWWNGPEEWSIAADNRRSAMWLARFLRRHGIKATTRAH